MYYPEFDEFKQGMWDLTKLNNPQTSYTFLISCLQSQTVRQEKDYDGNVVDYKLIKNKYIQYFNNWTAKFGSRDVKYIGKKDELEDIPSFIHHKMYLVIYTSLSSKTNYLFGNSDFDILAEKLKSFLYVIEPENTPTSSGSGEPPSLGNNTNETLKGNNNTTPISEGFL